MKAFTNFFLVAITIILLILNGCESSDPCGDVACLNGGICQDGTCICPDRFTGENCESTIDLCENVTCMNGGNCIDGTCECPIGWGGEFCETQLPQRVIINKIIVNDFPITQPNGTRWPLGSSESHLAEEPNIFVTVNDDVFSSDAYGTTTQYDAIPANGPFNFDAMNSPDMPFTVINVHYKNVAIGLYHKYFISGFKERLMGGYIVGKMTDSYPDTSIRLYDPNSGHQTDMTIKVEWIF